MALLHLSARRELSDSPLAGGSIRHSFEGLRSAKVGSASLRCIDSSVSALMLTARRYLKHSLVDFSIAAVLLKFHGKRGGIYSNPSRATMVTITMSGIAKYLRWQCAMTVVRISLKREPSVSLLPYSRVPMTSNTGWRWGTFPEWSTSPQIRYEIVPCKRASAGRKAQIAR